MNLGDASFGGTTVLFIGLGRMGRPMADRLAAAGCQIQVCDLRPELVADFRKAHAAKAEAPAEGYDVAITMLPNGNDVRQALLGEEGQGGVVAGLRRGGIVIDMSSSAPEPTRQLGVELERRGLHLLDAPVSGGVGRAANGTLSIMVGGPVDILDQVRALLLTMGRTILHTGPLGSGHAVKALNNLVSAAGLIIANEAVLTGARFGLSAETVVDVLNASTGRNNSTETKFRPFILSRSFNYGFSLATMQKDLRNAVELAMQTGTYAPMAQRCLELWQQAAEELGPDTDATAIIQHWEHRSGTTIHGSPA